MKLIDVLEVRHASGPKKIELFAGDLTRIPKAHAVDVLVVSAFPGDYEPTPTSLIGALDRKGVSVARLAEKPEADLTRDFSCWLSRPIRRTGKGLNFKRILCFEPQRKGHPPEVVGDIFQALAPFAFAKPHIKSVAMPIVAAGDQGHPIAEILPPLLDAAFHWLRQGFPIKTIKLVVHDQGSLQETKVIFAREAAKMRKLEQRRTGRPENVAMSPRARPDSTRFIVNSIDLAPVALPASAKAAHDYDYDVFISYSRQNEAAAQHLYQCLARAKLRVFIDRMEIVIGAAWQQKIFDALDSCNITAVLYSPAFLESKMCKEEFNIAWMRRRESERELLFPLLIEDTNLPTYMKLLNYLDCRISDKPKIEAAAARLVARLKSKAKGEAASRPTS
jgi:hypothetical protein